MSKEILLLAVGWVVFMQIVNPSPPTEWHEKTKFWGATSVFVAFGLAGGGLCVTGHLLLGRILFWCSYPFGVLALWCVVVGLVRGKRARLSIWVISSLVLAMIIGALDYWVVHGRLPLP